MDNMMSAASPSSIPHPGYRLLWLFIIALVVRLLFCFVFIPVSGLKIGPANRDFFIGTDGYIKLGENLAILHRLTFSADAPSTVFRAPMFPAAIALAYLVIGKITVALLLVNCLASAMNCVLADCILTRFRGRPLSWFWTIPVIVFPASIYYSASSWADTFFSFTIALYVLSLLVLLGRCSFMAGMVNGACFALSVLTKGMILLFPVPLLLYLLWRKRTCLLPAVVSMVFGYALVGIWTIRNYMTTGELVVVAGGSSMAFLIGNYMIERNEDVGISTKYGIKRAIEAAMGNDPDYRKKVRPNGFWDLSPALEHKFSEAAKKSIREDPMRLVRKCAINMVRLWYFAASPAKSAANAVFNGIILVLSMLALAKLARSHRIEIELLVLFGCYFLGLYAMTIASARYSLPLVIMLIPFASATLADIMVRWRRNREANMDRQPVGERF